MHDVPSGPVEKSRSEHEAAGGDFYDFAADFTVLHREIAKGVLDTLASAAKDKAKPVLAKRAL